MSINITPATHDTPPPPNAPWLVSSTVASKDEDIRRYNWRSMLRPQVHEPERKWARIGENPTDPDQPDWRGIRRSEVKELPMPKPYTPPCATAYPGYYWFDTPDWADPFSKLWFVARHAAWAAIISVPTGGLLLHSQYPNENFFTAKVMMSYAKRCALPIFVLPMVLGTGVICIANLRGKKDDNWNYFYAGMATAVFNGYRYNRWQAWWKSMVYGVPPFVMLKHIHETNNALMIRPSRRNRNSSGLYGGQSGSSFESADWTFGYSDAQRPVSRPLS